MSSLFLNDHLTLAFWSPGPAEMMVLAVVALLLYGGKLPEVARSWGKSFAEFRRGLSGFQSELNSVIYTEPEQLAYHEENRRDDARYANGYEESQDYGEDSEEASDDESLQDDTLQDDETLQDDIDEGEKTVKDVSADTVVIDKPEDKPTD